MMRSNHQNCLLIELCIRIMQKKIDMQPTWRHRANQYVGSPLQIKYFFNYKRVDKDKNHTSTFTDQQYNLDKTIGSVLSYYTVNATSNARIQLFQSKS